MSPPRLCALLARLLIRGDDRAVILGELAEAHARELNAGVPRGRAGRRYLANALGSSWSLATARLKRLVTHGAGLDVRLGIRLLGKQPMLTGVAMLALGLGIPASLSLHHLFNEVFSPLPVPDGEHIQGIRHWDLDARNPVMGSVHDYTLWRESLGSFEAIGAARSYSLNLHTGDPGAPPVRGSQVSASTFGIMSGAPLLGRVFGAADEVPGAPDVVILGQDVWNARFAGDPDIVGKTVRIGRREHTVVGVMPAGYRFPADDAVWLPLRASPADYALGEGPELWVYGRLAEGITSDVAEAEVALVTERLAADHAVIYERYVGEVVEMPMLFLREMDATRTEPDLLLGQALVGVLLLIVCGNVATLMLARTSTRSAELSIRTALGASRGRIVTQLFIEALVLAVTATGLGLLLGEATARWLTRAVEPFDMLPYWVDLSLGPRIIATAFGLAIVSAVLAGVLPAFKATARGVQSNLQRTAAGGVTARFGLGSSLLIVGEVVLSVGFLAMGGVVIRTFLQDTESELGFEPERYVQASLQMPWLDPAEYPEYADEAVFRTRLAEAQREVARRLFESDEVRAVGMGRNVPGQSHPRRRLILESGPVERGDLPASDWTRVEIGFFEGLGRRVVAGRAFSTADVEPGPDEHRPAAIVNTSFVEEVLGGRSPIGQRFRYQVFPRPDPSDYAWYEIVGVVEPFGTNPLNPTRDAAIYHPLAVGELNPLLYLVEVAGDPSAFVPRFREIVAAADPEATLAYPAATTDVMRVEYDFFRWAFTMQLTLAAVAFLLAVSGLYALMSFTVAQRTREIGIRTALGARPGTIVSTIARRAAIQLAVGLSLGGVFAWLLLVELVEDGLVMPTSIPLTIAITVSIAAVVGVAACASPTLRGLRIQPTEALREG